eukprot:115310-Amphidinium_carterae.1
MRFDWQMLAAVQNELVQTQSVPQPRPQKTLPRPRRKVWAAPEWLHRLVRAQSVELLSSTLWVFLGDKQKACRSSRRRVAAAAAAAGSTPSF